MRLLRRDGVEVTPKGRKAQGLLGAARRRAGAQAAPQLAAGQALERPAARSRARRACGRSSPASAASLGEASDCLTTEGGWVALDPGRVRVKLDPDPDDWELTGAPPEFVAGLDIADPEFEDWIRDQRAVFAERLEAAPPPARTAAVVP